MRNIFSLLIIITISGFAIADEGMWTMDQIDKLDLQKKGLKIPLEEVYNTEGTSLFNAIVNLGGGTSEFVSSNGLILTNHHVAYGAVQRASTQGTDYLTNGFLANSFWWHAKHWRTSIKTSPPSSSLRLPPPDECVYLVVWRLGPACLSSIMYLTRSRNCWRLVN